MLSLEQEFINEQTAMKPQQYNSDTPNISILSSLPLNIGPEVDCDEGRHKREISRLLQMDNLQLYKTETFFPCWDEEAHDDDSQSCEWSIDSSNTFGDEGCWDDEDPDETVELDQYLVMSMERHRIDRERVIKFNDDPVSAVYSFEKPTRDHYKNLYYTVHELQSMIDEFIQNGGSRNFLSSSSD